MPEVELTVPQGAQSFQHNGQTYGPGSKYTTSDPCDALRFADAFQQVNPDAGRRNQTPGAWESTYEACPAGEATEPAPAPPGTPTQTDPQATGGDSGDDQGAPAPTRPPVSVTAPPSPPSTSDESPTPPFQTEEPRRPPEGRTDPAQVREVPQEPELVSDPVELFSGSYRITEIDLEIPSTLLPMTFIRTYRSGTPSFGPLGWNWDHNFNVYLRELASGDVAVWRQLHEDVFRATGAGFEPPRGVFEVLSRVPGGGQEWVLDGVGGNRAFFERPGGWVDGERVPLVRLEDRHGNALRLSYTSRDQLAEVRDDFDRVLALEYDECGLLVAVSDGGARRFTYTHDEQTFHLDTVTTPPLPDHPDGLTRVYHYAHPGEPPMLRHGLVRIEDAAGRTYLQNHYDPDPASYSFGRVLEQLFGDQLFQYRYSELQWVPPHGDFVNVPSVRTEVMNPDNGVETYTFNFRGDLLDHRFRLSADRTFRVAALQYEYDEQGNLVSTTRPDGSRELSTYDPDNADPRMRGLRTRRELTAASGFPSPSRIVWRGTYEATYQLLVREEDEGRHVTRYDYDLTVSPGAATNSGKLVHVRHPDLTLPDGTVEQHRTSYEHLGTGQVSAVIDPDGLRTELEHGTNGAEAGRLVREVRDPGGLSLTTTTEYDAAGYRSAVVDPGGRRYETEVDALGQLVSTRGPEVGGLHGSRVLHYDRDRRVASAERPRGDYDDPVLAGAAIRDVFARDVLGNPVEMVLGDNTSSPRTVRSRFDHRGFPLRSVLPDGAVLERTYDERGLLIEETYTGADGARQHARSAYDVNGTLVRSTDAGGAVTTYDRDAFNRVRRVRAPSGTETALTWGEDDVLLAMSITGADDQGTVRLLGEERYEYDEWRRRIRVTVCAFDQDPTAAVDVVTTTFYDAADRPLRVVDVRGGQTVHEYDTVGRLVATTDPVGNRVEQSYDGSGAVVERREVHREPGGGSSTLVHRLEYDARGRPAARRHPDGSARTTELDDRDLPVREVDELGTVTAVGYDAFGVRTTEVVDAAGLALTHTWTHDALGRVTGYTDPAGQTTHYQLDGLGRRTRVDLPSGSSSLREFDAAGNLLRETSAGGTVLELEHDVAHRVVRVRNTATAAGVLPVPDQVRTYDGLDRVVSASSGPGTEVRRRYDSQGRLRVETTGGASISLDPDDLTGTLVRGWPDGRRETVTTDAAGFPVRVAQTQPGSVGRGTGTLCSLTPSGPDRAGTVTVGAGVALTDSFDDRKRLVDRRVEAAGATTVAVGYDHDAADRRRVEVHDAPVAGGWSHEFDAAGRLVRSIPADGQPQVRFDYTAVDARLRRQRTGQPDLDYTHLPGHRPATAGPEGFSYGPDDVRRSDAAHDYTVDALGRVVEVSSAGAVVCRIDHDGLGRPALVTEDGAAPLRLRWFGDLVLEEDDGSRLCHLTPDPVSGLPLLEHVAGEARLRVHDGRWNLVALLDWSGSVLESYRYQPFGELEVRDAAGAPRGASAFGVAPVFGGQRYLSSCGLYLSRRRLMDPRHGVFLAPDPLGYTSSAALDVYAAQDPVDLVDPSGEFPFLAVLGVMAIGAVVAGGINVARQHIQMAENPARREQGFSWGELGLSMGIGAVAAPLLVVAPELAIPLAAVGVAGGAREIANGNYATGTFDIVTSVAPFGSKNVRTGSYGQGTVYRGWGQSASWQARTGRFTQVGQNPVATLRPSGPRGRDIGVGYAAPEGSTRGHTGVIVDEGSGFTLFHKNGQRSTHPDWRLEAAWAIEAPPPTTYNLPPVPFRYQSVRVPRSVAESMSGYARTRMAGREEFAFGRASCSYFTADVLNAGGIRGMQGANETSFGVYQNFLGFTDARNAASLAWGSGFWTPMPTAALNRKCAPAPNAP